MPAEHGTDPAIRILYLEDDEATGRLFQKTLERRGLRVELAHDAATGLARSAVRPYDVVVVDYDLPRVSGLEAIRELRERTDPPPIVMVTGEGDEMVAVEAMKLGATDYVVKDVDNRYLALLPGVIENALAAHRAEMERRAAVAALARSNKELRDALERQREQVIRDPLTDLYNRRFMEEALDREMRRARRRHAPLGVVILDIDDFKHLNDTEGHPAGDAVLRHLGKLLRRRVRGEDIVCRYGGEEFVLILPDSALESCRQVAEELRQAIEGLRTAHFTVTASFGVAAFPDHGRTPEGLLQAADGALYEAKAKGRNRVSVAAPLARAS